MGVYVVGDIYMPMTTCWSKEFLEYSFPYRIFYYFVSLSFKRYFYYSPFCISTGAVVASGLGYNGVKKVGEKEEHRWDKIVSIYIFELETMTSPIDGMRYWNHMVHIWLKFYVQGRLVEPGKRPGFMESMSTFIVSAFWHGFQPMFYLMFFLAALIVEVAKDFFKARYIFKFIPSWLRPILANFFTMLGLNYLGTLHNAKSFTNGFMFMGATYYFVYVGVVAILFVSRTFGLVKFAQSLEKKSVIATEKD